MRKRGDIPYENITEAQDLLSKLTVRYWFDYNFLTVKWWILVGLSTVPLIIWGIILDKSRAKQIIMFGLLTSLTASVFDTIGFTMGFWGYPVKLIPVNPPYFPVDFVYLPVMYMLIYQYFPRWKSFIIVNILASLFYTFVGEPIFEWLDMYRTYSWHYIISLPIYILMALFFKWFVDLFTGTGESADSPKNANNSKGNPLFSLSILTLSASIIIWSFASKKRKTAKNKKWFKP